MKIKILTLFPEMLAPVLSASILGRAIAAGALDVELINIRDYAENRHKNTDDYPFGGGAGMVMMPQPVVDAVEKNAEPGMKRIYLSPRGRVLTQRVVEELAQEQALLFLCGHYEGVDQRALDRCVDEELSIGDYVLTGGELGALVAVDAVARLLPDVLGSEESSMDESFTTGLLEYPQYTRPADFRGECVPEVLLGGNHKDIEAWRRREALQITRARRPELLKTAPLTDEDHLTLEKLAHAEETLAQWRARGIKAERLEMFAETAYAKEWFGHIVPKDKRADAKKPCFSGRRHVGYLYRALAQGFVPCRCGAEAQEALAGVDGSAVYYDDRRGLAYAIDDARAFICAGISLTACTLLTAADFSWCCAAGTRAEELYFFPAAEVTP